MKKGQAFKNHSVFMYNTEETIETFGGLDTFIKVCKNLQINAVWFRTHGSRGFYGNINYNKNLMKRLKENNILSAHWGWCQGYGSDHININNAIKEYEEYCDTYIADIEPDVSGSIWDEIKINNLIDKINKDNIFFAITTFGFVPWHQPELWSSVKERVDGWDIQAYWHNLPSKLMVSHKYVTKDQIDNPSEYCKLCIKEWKKVVGENSLIHLSGQAYHGEGGFTKKQSEDKWIQFFEEFDKWDEICGFGYWHLSSLARSTIMVETLKKQNISKYFETIKDIKTIEYNINIYSELVEQYQQFLKNLGFNIKADGYAGPKTSNIHFDLFKQYLINDPRNK